MEVKMDFSYIETLANKSKDGDSASKEELALQFKPFIINLSKKTFIDGYDKQDIMNECYRILFRCVDIYDSSRHRFVAYATNGIKNSIYYLVTRSVKFSKIHGQSSQILTDEFLNNIVSDHMTTEDLLCRRYDFEPLEYAIKQLNKKEKTLINHVFFKKKKLKDYAISNNISYSYATKFKRHTLDKLHMHINNYNQTNLYM
ncbi:MAG TPA: sigma-70 family RNA polymerase sigma factor [Clostridium sp.]|nr:sigma-70 family RNA polymerase sigma factor [Clostridium sp.]